MIVDLSFRVSGGIIPSDHNYALFSSLSSHFPVLHSADWLAVQPITGTFLGDGKLQLTKNSRLRLRLPIGHIAEVLPLAGKVLTLSEDGKKHSIQVCIPEIYTLSPCKDLISRCVTIKVSESEKSGVSPTRESFLEALNRKMNEQGLKGEIWIDDGLDSKGREVSRRVIRIKGQIVIGYTVIISKLSAEDSIKLQERGLGGKRKMGCGFFVPLLRSKYGIQ